METGFTDLIDLLGDVNRDSEVEVEELKALLRRLIAADHDLLIKAIEQQDYHNRRLSKLEEEVVKDLQSRINRLENWKVWVVAVSSTISTIGSFLFYALLKVIFKQ